MSAPFLDGDGATSLVAAVAIGIAFGAALERAGLGSARKLVGQFFVTDLTVFQVMFTAIVVALLGVFWLERFGVLDASRVAVPETFLAPQIVGGLVFGAGMAMGGLCPGTSCVAAATGRGDGVAVLLGILAGVLVTGLAFEWLQPFYESTALGPLTVPDWLGVTPGVIVLAVVAIALVGFRVVARIGVRP